MQGITTVLSRPTTLNLSDNIRSDKIDVCEPDFVSKKKLYPSSLRRTHSLIVSRPPLPSARGHSLRSRSRSTASTPHAGDDRWFSFDRKMSLDVIGTRVLEDLQENGILYHSQKNDNEVIRDVTSTSSRRASQNEPRFAHLLESPMKVFSRFNFGRSLTPDGRLDQGSCHAVRTALSTLYNIEDFDMVQIGEGFFSEVFKVVHKTFGKVMVLKRNKHRANRSSMLKEIQLLNTLHHPNILRLEGACVHEGQLHALTEFVEGGSLDQLIAKISKDGAENEFPWKLRISIAKDVSQGVEYLHSQGFFHRDLTSKNILIHPGRNNSELMRAVVGDFGLATRIPRSADEHLPQVGSPYWMSPECLHGHFYNETTDVFSFGIILCEIIACVEADPDLLPRTENFGVDYVAFSELVPAACPSDFLKMAFQCVTIDPKRPQFRELRAQLEKIFEFVLKEEQVANQQQQLSTMQKAHLKTSPDTPVKSGNKLSRRCFSQRKTARCSPSEAARHHVSTAAQLVKKIPRIYTETPVKIGEKMSKLDPFYIPSPATGINPFVHLPRSALGGGKILGPRDLFYSCFEVLSLSDCDVEERTSEEGPAVDSPVYRKAVSMVNRDPLSTEDLIAEIDEQVRNKNIH